jgi:CHAD domain-containing protein
MSAKVSAHRDPASFRLGEALHVLARAECDTIDRALGRSRDRHRAVHRARKAIRSLRAIMALLGPVSGEQATWVDKELKSLALELSPLRDAHVAVAVAEKLAGDEPSSAWHRVAHLLVARRNRLLRQTLLQDPAFAGRRARLQQIASALDALRWDSITIGLVERALEQSENRVHRAARRARHKGTAACMHRWRRRARRQRLQIDAARRACKPQAGLLKRLSKEGKTSARLKRLADQLGWRQDLEVMRSLLDDLPDASLPLAELRKQLRRAMRGGSVS